VAVASQTNGSGEREVLVYMCPEPFGWFTGSTEEDEFSLSAAGRDPSLKARNARAVDVKLTPEAAVGKFTLENGQSLSFTATPATGAAGLYEATLSDDQQLNGSSLGGGQMRARLLENQARGLIVKGTFTGGGQTIPFELPGGGIEPGDFNRLVVLPDGRVEGKVRSIGGSFSCWLPDL
jgi:hypothetical protein